MRHFKRSSTAGDAFSSALHWVSGGLLTFSLVILLLILTPPSPASGQASPPTTSTASSGLASLLPLAEAALDSSVNSETQTANLVIALDEANKLRQTDNEARQREQVEFQTKLDVFSSRLTTLQTWFDNLSFKLGAFSGSEEEKYQTSLKAVDSITSGVKALENENFWLKVGLVGSGIALVAIIIFEETRKH